MAKKPRTLTENFASILEIYRPYWKELVTAGQSYPVGFWTPLKLRVVSSYINNYLGLVPDFVDNLFYIDLLANSGINSVSSCRDCEESNCVGCKNRTKKEPPFPFPGSPLLAATTKRSFKKMYFVDSCEEYPGSLAILDKRLKILQSAKMCSSPYATIRGDCNLVIDQILGDIRKGSGSKEPNLFVFADNEGLDVKWATISKLLSCKYCDLLINYPTTNIRRAFGQRKAGYGLQRVHDFFGDTVDEMVSEDEALLDLYVRKLKSFGKTVEIIPINTDIAFSYKLILVTKGNAKFAPYLTWLRESSAKNSARDVEYTFKILSGKQKALGEYQSG